MFPRKLFSPRKTAGCTQYDCRECGTRELVLFPTLAHENINIEIRQKQKKPAKDEKIIWNEVKQARNNAVQDLHTKIFFHFDPPQGRYSSKQKKKNSSIAPGFTIIVN